MRSLEGLDPNPGQEGEGELVHAKANNQHKQDLGLNC